MIKATITSYYLSTFLEELKSACKKMRVSYGVAVGEKRVVGQVNMTDHWDTSSFSNFKDVYGYDVEIEIPEIDKMTNTGYEYLGCIKDDGLISVHPNNNADFDLSSMEEIKTFPCDRCGKKVKRNIIHVFRKDGDVTVYGSGCAKTKFGIDLNVIIDKFSRIMEQFGISEIDDDGYYGGGRGWNVIDADAWCTIAYHEITDNGYVSGTKVMNEGGLSTKDCVDSDYTELMDGENRMRVYYDSITETKEFNLAHMLGWATVYVNELEEGDFKFNMKGALEVLLEGYVHPRMGGYVAFLVFKYWFDTVKASEKKEEVEWNTDYSNMEVKERLRDIKAVCINEYTFETQWGATTIYTFRGVEDNIKYKWFASKQIDTEGEFMLTGTVKAFEDDAKYGKAVILTRCLVKYPELEEE